MTTNEDEQLALIANEMRDIGRYEPQVSIELTEDPKGRQVGITPWGTAFIVAQFDPTTIKFIEDLAHHAGEQDGCEEWIESVFFSIVLSWMFDLRATYPSLDLPPMNMAALERLAPHEAGEHFF